MKIKRIGTLTGGGDCPGLNAVLRAIVKSAKVEYEYDIIGFKDGYRGLVENNFVNLGLDDVSGILDRGGTILGTSNRDNPFEFGVYEDGAVKYKDMSGKAIENMNNLEIDAMIIIGGDGTLSSARRFSEMGVKVVGVPKTIDNDLCATDTTFGFATAVNTATEAIDKLHSTAESHHRIMVLEVMGRYAGWIALESGIAGGADVILIPEIPYDINKVADKIAERKQSGKSFSIIVVAEGAKPIDGNMVIDKVIGDSPDPIRLGGIGREVAYKLEKLTGLEARVTVLGHLQRGGTPVPFDRILSTRYGIRAVESVEKSMFGTMVGIKGNQLVNVLLSEAVGMLKTVDPKGELVEIAKDIGVGFGD